MIINLPIQSKILKDGKLYSKESEKAFNLDMSLAAQIRFESNFPELAAREDLYGYSDRINKVESVSAGAIISKMKMLYCWFDTDISFIDFLRLFDFTDLKYIDKLTNALKEAFEIIINASAEKN